MAWGCMVVLGEEAVETSVDYGAASTDMLYTTLEEIASGSCRVEYLELWFADGRGNAGFLEEALAGVDGTAVGYIPWKALEVRNRTIERKKRFPMRE